MVSEGSKRWPTLVVRVVGMAVLLGMGLYPPWQATYTAAGGADLTKNVGYSWAFSPPIDRVTVSGSRVHINLPRVAAQLIGTFVVISALVAITRSRT